MFIDWNTVRIFVRPGVTDLRKQANGLAVEVQSTMKQDPLSGYLFVFCNGERRLLKIVYWDRNGFALWQKRIEREKFPWPRTEEAAGELSVEQLRMLLAGIDFFHAHRVLHYTSVL